jgi:hypothetical protein
VLVLRQKRNAPPAWLGLALIKEGIMAVKAAAPVNLRSLRLLSIYDGMKI